IPKDEAQRLERLRLYRILDTPTEESFDRITRIVAETIGVPIALVSLVDEGRQWFKSKHGIDAAETSREIAFCSHAILGDKTFVVEDASQDDQFFDNPLVTSDPNIRFYAGAPLKTAEGLNLGTLCAIGQVPRKLSKSHQQLLEDLAHLVVDEMELRTAFHKALNQAAEELRLRTMHDDFIATINHELRSPLTSIRGTLGLLEGGAGGELSEEVKNLVGIAS
ncbi:MAG: GAF domain-containing protein, partial [Rhodospirillales bacterium]